jgi:hypothetical protein
MGVRDGQYANLGHFQAGKKQRSNFSRVHKTATPTDCDTRYNSSLKGWNAFPLTTMTQLCHLIAANCKWMGKKTLKTGKMQPASHL